MKNVKDKFELQLRLDFSDMDMFGHINNISYFKFIQSARVNFWEKTGVYEIFEKEKKGPILASTQMDFKKPLHYPGDVIIETKLVGTGNTSFTLEHRILNQDKEVSAIAKDVIVMFDFKTNQKISLPEQMKVEG